VMVGSGPSRLTVVRSVAGLALSDLVDHRRREALLGIGGVALATALLGGILLLVLGFAGTLDTTILGTYLSGRVRPFHLATGALTLAVAAMAVAQVITTAYLEREPDLAALRALGWPRSALGTYLLAQAAAIGLLGGVVGAGLTVAIGVALTAAPQAILIAAGTVGLAALLLSLGASVGPLVYAYRSQPAQRLHGE
jgi:MFS family permease